MSVINTMLRDLESRRGPAQHTPAAVRAAAPGTRRRAPLWVAAGAAVALAAAFGDWPALLPANAARVPQPAHIVDTAPAAEAPVVDVALAPAVLPAAKPAPRREQARAARVAPAPAADPPQLLARADLRAPASALAVSPPAAAPVPAGQVHKTPTATAPVERAQHGYRLAIELASSGQGHAAVAKLREALQVDPGLNAARVLAVSLLYEQQRGSEADALAREGLALAPDDVQLVYLLARAQAARGDSAAALELLQRSPKLSADAIGLRAGLLAQQGDFKRALPDYQQAVRAQPGNSLWWLGLGVALEADGQPQQARRVYQRAQSLGVDTLELNVFLDQKLASIKP